MFDAEFSKVNRNGTSFITCKSPSVSLLDTAVAASNVANQTLASASFVPSNHLLFYLSIPSLQNTSTEKSQTTLQLGVSKTPLHLLAHATVFILCSTCTQLLYISIVDS